ncbi:MAG: ABC transporter substrate-binding protein [Martelella sp.]|uniref:ABC transporter substrate-binding protein n=1 Tax=Martelella sp. TaxID=1969699 RepID=UPI0032427179
MKIFGAGVLIVSGVLAAAVPAAAKSELILAIGGEPDTGYDPLLGWGRYGHPLFQSTLLKRDAALETVPDLASAWSLSDDRLVWTITLRPGVTFSDGTPLSAEDVAFTFNEAAKAGGVLDLTVMDSAEAIDDLTVEIRLKRPWVTFSENFYSLGIVPSDGYGPGYARNPVGSGPFKMVSWTEGEQLIVEANPDYYGQKPEFERLTFVFSGEDTSLAAARTGQVDMVSVPALMADDNIDGFRKVTVPAVDNRGLSFPMTAPGQVNGETVGNDVTSDLAIRRAVNLGVDREQLVEVALNGYGRPAYGPADGLPWSNPDAAVAHDPDGARALLDEAGWAVGDDGIRVRDGVKAAFDIYYPASDSVRQALAVVTAEQLKSLGIAARPMGATWEQIGRVDHQQPVMFGWGSHSPLEVYSLYNSAWGGIEFYNPGYFSDETVDAHFADAQQSASLEASYPDWQAAEWDGQTGFSARGLAGWAWLVNLDHVYFATDCLDIGDTQVEPHGHGWPITAMIEQWKWTCE